MVPKTLVGKLVGVGAEVRELSSHVVDQHQHQLNTHGKGGSIHAPHIEAPHASSEPPRTAPTPYPPPGAPGLQEPFVAKENGGNNPKRGAERLEGTEAAAKIARRAPPPAGAAGAGPVVPCTFEGEAVIAMLITDYSSEITDYSELKV